MAATFVLHGWWRTS
ncbi:trp operon leader peptide [Salmonella enterica subsp. houtenae]|uniref:trp operon leader peptide n=28 Tax=Salmonella enterica TaxID=28901 RepID=A0A3V2Y430_SALET|nr:trp operon leader peptide [Salmonella enterica]EAA4083359.1 trp operon leader peptide [Salmonella enterica subsp. salamae serovar Sofia]EAU5131922.1 trp operon leader peptide [Salmonella enterica subsp. enterica serovar Oranienburg]EBH8100987.1 trp operon leader peptide [Salmonella enterica subsp. houtenae serovar O:11:g,z25:-]EBH8333837.1 trp operon leader peptide [Salmonella enterica subsp. houtenae serovar Houten]EBI0041302.1 trp operon leader peptide [Salmonella enterica subsp. diarizon